MAAEDTPEVRAAVHDLVARVHTAATELRELNYQAAQLLTGPVDVDEVDALAVAWVLNYGGRDEDGDPAPLLDMFDVDRLLLLAANCRETLNELLHIHMCSCSGTTEEAETS